MKSLCEIARNVNNPDAEHPEFKTSDKNVRPTRAVEMHYFRCEQHHGGPTFEFSSHFLLF
jgi:hypothetical protein